MALFFWNIGGLTRKLNNWGGLPLLLGWLLLCWLGAGESVSYGMRGGGGWIAEDTHVSRGHVI